MVTIAASGWFTSWAIDATSSPIVVTRVTRASSSWDCANASSARFQFDWAHKAYSTNAWGMIAARHFFDDIMMTRDAISVGIMLTFAFETGFTNMQFLGLAADASEVGDHNTADDAFAVSVNDKEIFAPRISVLQTTVQSAPSVQVLTMPSMHKGKAVTEAKPFASASARKR